MMGHIKDERCGFWEGSEEVTHKSYIALLH